MPQEFQVLQCFSCQTFQVHQVKKALKWACKLCGEKQSIKKVFGRGTGAECRQHVQTLNTLRGEMDQARGNLATRGRDLANEGYIQKDLPDWSSHEQSSHNKWQAYIDDDVAADHEDVESEDGATLYTTDAREAIQFRRGAKRKSPSDVPISKRGSQEYNDWGSNGGSIRRQKYTDSSEYNHEYRNHQPSGKHFYKPAKLTPSYNDRPATDRFAVPAAAIYEVDETGDADEEYNTLMSQQPGLKQQLVTTHTDALRCQDSKFRNQPSKWKTVGSSGFKDQIDNETMGPRLSTGIGMSKWASFTTVQPITKESSQEELTGPKNCLQSSQESEQDRSTWDELGGDLSVYSGQECDNTGRGQGQGSNEEILGQKCGTNTLTGRSLKSVMKPFKADKENFDLNNICSVNPVSEGENSGCQFAPLEATSNISSRGYSKVDDKMLPDNLPGKVNNDVKVVGKLYNQEAVGSLFKTGDLEDFDFEL